MKALFGAIIVKGSGKLGGSVISGSRSGTVLKTKVSPINRSSLTQTITRGNLSYISGLWRSLSESQRKLWEAAGKNFPISNAFGGNTIPSGFELYCSVNCNLLNAGISPLSTPPGTINRFNFDSISVWISNTDNTLWLDLRPGIPSTHIVKVFITKPLSPGVTEAYKQFVEIAQLSSVNMSPISISSPYISRFVSLGYLNQKIFVKLIICEKSSGVTSVPYKLVSQVTVANSPNIGLTWSDIGQFFSQSYIYSLLSLGNGVCIAGTDPNGKILRSSDNGATWPYSVSLTGAASIQSLAYLGKGICIAGCSNTGRIFRSTDSGFTWTDLGQQVSQQIVESVCYLENGIALAGTYNGSHILRSTDYGAHWTDLGSGFGLLSVHCFCYLGNGIVLAGTYNGGTILRSIDYGQTWVSLGQQFGETYLYSFAKLGNGIVLAGTGLHGHILRSTDYGANWSDLGQQFTRTRIYSLIYAGNNVCLAGCYPGGYILRSTDNGQTWSNLGQQYAQTTIISLAQIAKDVYLAGTGANGHILRSTV